MKSKRKHNSTTNGTKDDQLAFIPAADKVLAKFDNVCSGSTRISPSQVTMQTHQPLRDSSYCQQKAAATGSSVKSRDQPKLKVDTYASVISAHNNQQTLEGKQRMQEITAQYGGYYGPHKQKSTNSASSHV